jgi:hypothetical protein
MTTSLNVVQVVEQSSLLALMFKLRLSALITLLSYRTHWSHAEKADWYTVLEMSGGRLVTSVTFGHFWGHEQPPAGIVPLQQPSYRLNIEEQRLDAGIFVHSLIQLAC